MTPPTTRRSPSTLRLALASMGIRRRWPRCEECGGMIVGGVGNIDVCCGALLCDECVAEEIESYLGAAAPDGFDPEQN